LRQELSEKPNTEVEKVTTDVDQIQQKLNENPSKASRQLREQGRQIGRSNNQFKVKESSLGLVEDVTEGVVKFLHPRADKKLDAELMLPAVQQIIAKSKCQRNAASLIPRIYRTKT
jgi:hypothetical protein